MGSITEHANSLNVTLPKHSGWLMERGLVHRDTGWER
jgi:hypothetical protein